MSDMNFDIEGYADDHQIYKPFTTLFQVTVLAYDIKKCFGVISDWMVSHFLRLNPDKTKILVIGSPNVLSQIEIHGAVLNCSTCIRFCNEAKNLGVILDNKLKFKSQVNSVVKRCFYVLRMLFKMKRYLNTAQKKTLVFGLILSVLDYSNSIYYGIDQELFNKLQLVQNTAARLIFNSRKFDSASELCLRLHWLPAQERIVFKVLLFVFKCLHDLVPQYLSNLIIPACSERNPYDLVPKALTSFGDRAFSIAGPRAWNTLPAEIRSLDKINDFKKALKTYLFNNSHKFFNDIKMQ